jgi:hypothetical protein
MVCGVGLKGQSSGFRVFRVQRRRVSVSRNIGMRLLPWVSDAGIRASGFGIRDSGFGIRDSGFGGFGIRVDGPDSDSRQAAPRALLPWPTLI